MNQEKTKLNTLPLDVLSEIYEYLNLWDAIQLKNASPLDFGEAAHFHFRRNYKKFNISFMLKEQYCQSSLNNLQSKDIIDFIEQILYEIGEYIIDLTVDYVFEIMEPENRSRPISLLIQKYCTNLEHFRCKSLPFGLRLLAVPICNRLKSLWLVYFEGSIIDTSFIDRTRIFDDVIEQYLRQCSNTLEILSITYNPLITGECLKYAPNLKSLTLMECSQCGIEFRNNIYLYLSMNKKLIKFACDAHFHVPKLCDYLNDVQQLKISYFNETIVDIGHLEHLTHLDLHDQEPIDEHLPSVLKLLAQRNLLKRLRLRFHNQIPIIVSRLYFPRLTNLETLILTVRYNINETLKNLRNNLKLTHFELKSNELFCKVNNLSENLINLEYLKIYLPRSGKFLSTFFMLTRLTTLNLKLEFFDSQWIENFYQQDMNLLFQRLSQVNVLENLRLDVPECLQITQETEKCLNNFTYLKHFVCVSTLEDETFMYQFGASLKCLIDFHCIFLEQNQSLDELRQKSIFNGFHNLIKGAEQLKYFTISHCPQEINEKNEELQKIRPGLTITLTWGNVSVVLDMVEYHSRPHLVLDQFEVDNETNDDHEEQAE